MHWQNLIFHQFAPKLDFVINNFVRKDFKLKISGRYTCKYLVVLLKFSENLAMENGKSCQFVPGKEED